MIIDFLRGVVDVAIVVLLSVVLLVLRDVRDCLETVIAQNRLEAKRREWVKAEHDEH